MAFGETFKKKFKGAAKRIKSAFEREHNAAPSSAAKRKQQNEWRRKDEADTRKDATDTNADDGSSDTDGGAMRSGQASSSAATNDVGTLHINDSQDESEEATESQTKNYARPPGMSDAEWERYRVDLARRIEARHRANCSQREREQKHREEAERMRREQEEIDRILEEAKAAAEALRRRNRVAASATPSAPGASGGAGAIILDDPELNDEVESGYGISL